MPSTRNQKVQEERSQQSDVTFDMEKLDVMQGRYSTNEAKSQLSENEKKT